MLPDNKSLNRFSWELKLRIVTGIANSRTIISAEILTLKEKHLLRRKPHCKAVRIPICNTNSRGWKPISIYCMSSGHMDFFPQLRWLWRGFVRKRVMSLPSGLISFCVLTGKPHRDIYSHGFESCLTISVLNQGLWHADIWEPVSSTSTVQPNDDDSSGEIAQDYFSYLPSGRRESSTKFKVVIGWRIHMREH